MTRAWCRIAGTALLRELADRLGLTGYGGGLARKAALLDLEGAAYGRRPAPAGQLGLLSPRRG